MASLGMQGPFDLNSDSIDKHVIEISPGNYALGYVLSNKFVVMRIGRSDSDINKKLHEWIWDKSHTMFKFSYAESAKAAFEKECQNFHDFQPDENTDHPARPDNTNWHCPVCGI